MSLIEHLVLPCGNTTTREHYGFEVENEVITRQYFELPLEIQKHTLYRYTAPG